MTDAIHKISDFRASVFDANVARTERFEIEINFPPGINNTEADRVVSIMCEECNIPGIANSMKPHRINNWTFYRNTNMDYMGTEAVFTFIERQEWDIRSRIEQWLSWNVNPITKEVKFPNDTEGQIAIHTLDMEDKVTANWYLYGATPKIINIQPLANNSPGVVRTTVTFSFNRWSSGVITSVPGSGAGVEIP